MLKRMYSLFEANTFEQASSSQKKSSLIIQPGDFRSSSTYVIGPKITLPSGQMEKVNIRTDDVSALRQHRKRPPLSLFHTEPLLPALLTRSREHIRGENSFKGLHLSPTAQLLQEEEEALALQTFPLRAVKNKRATRKARSFVAGIILFGVSVLTLGAGIALLVVVPGIWYKSTVVLLLLMMLSYLLSAQAKRAYQARQRYLSMKQLTRSSTAENHPERYHLTLIKQDTTGYLRALTTDQVRKGLRR